MAQDNHGDERQAAEVNHGHGKQAAAVVVGASAEVTQPPNIVGKYTEVPTGSAPEGCAAHEAHVPTMNSDGTYRTSTPQEQLSPQEQYAVIFGMINLIYCATSVLGILLIGLFYLGYYIFRKTIKEFECEHEMWKVAFLIVSARGIDTLSNISAAVCGGPSRPVPSRRHMLSHIVSSVLIAIVVMALGICLIVVASDSFGNAGKDCEFMARCYLAGGIFYVVSELAEITVWGFIFWIWRKAGTNFTEDPLAEHLQQKCPQWLKQRAALACAKDICSAEILEQA